MVRIFIIHDSCYHLQVTDKLQALNDEFTKKQKEKKDLEDSIVKCEQKRDRSERLIGSLGGERGR